MIVFRQCSQYYPVGRKYENSLTQPTAVVIMVDLSHMDQQVVTNKALGSQSEKK